MYSTLLFLACLAQTVVAEPIARAGRTFLAYPGESIKLDGTTSTGTSLAFRWVQVGGPRVPLTGADTRRPSFFTDRPGRYSFELTVREASQQSSYDEVDVVVLDPEIGTRYEPATGCMYALVPATTWREHRVNVMIPHLFYTM